MANMVRRFQYLYIRHNNLYLLALTKRNSNAAELLLFLHKIVEVFTEYFKELEEESIRDNFVIIYELLDEMMDFGHPQTTESKILQECVIARNVLSLLAWLLPANASLQVHHPRITQTRNPSATAHRCHKCCLMALRRHSISQERSLPRRSRVAQFARIRNRQCASIRNSRRNQNEVLSLRHARAPTGLERQSHVRNHRAREQRKSSRNGRRQVSPMRAPIAIRERQNHFIHPTRRRIRAHVLPPQHPSQATHLG